LAKWWN